MRINGATKMIYKPDNWVIMKFPQGYKLLAGWSGGYLGGYGWRLNSGVTGCHMEVDGDYYFFTSHSGSTYRCHKDSYGLRMSTAHPYSLVEHQAEMMPEDTNWLEMDWEIK